MANSFSNLTEQLTPEEKQLSDQYLAELLEEYDAKQPSPDEQPTNHDVYEFLYFDMQNEILELRRQVSDLHVLVEKQFSAILSLLEKPDTAVSPIVYSTIKPEYQTVREEIEQ